MAETASRSRPARFIAGLGIAQIASWGTLYYSFPLLAEPTAASLGLGKVEVYGAASIGLASGALAAYPIGRLIDAGRGQAVMSLGGALGALMLLLWSRIDDPAWLVPLFVGIGLAQAASLYEPAFAVIARRLGPDAREGITRLTLWGGFASTVFIPITQFLMLHMPWRDALLVLGALQFGIAAVTNGWLTAEPVEQASAAQPASRPPRSIARWALGEPVFWALLVAFTVYYGAFSAVTLHLYPLLVERGLSPASVVLVLGVVGPAQVLGRVLLWKGASTVPARTIGLLTVTALSASLLLLDVAGTSLATLLVFAVVYGCANGVMTIVRGIAVPEMLSRESYGALNGLLATPVMVAKAIAPVAAAATWTIGKSYELVLTVAISSSLVVVLSFALASVLIQRRKHRAFEGDVVPE